MSLQTVATSAVGGVRALSDELRGFARLEQFLGGSLLLAPAVMIAVDTGPQAVRDSISAYHDVGHPPAFYVPLTIGAMLFLVNATLRRAHIYNALLGVALLGLIIFDNEEATWVHGSFAGAFFAGNFLVMMFFSTNKSLQLKLIFAGAIVTAAALWIAVSLFCAEWVSLAIVATHYILDSVSWSKYRALQPGELPRLVP